MFYFYFKAGHPNKALRYFQEATSFGLFPSSNLYAYAIKALTDTNKLDLATKMWKKAKNQISAGPELYLWSSRALLLQGDKEEAKKSLVMARRCPAFYNNETIQFIIENFSDDLDLLQKTFSFSQKHPHIILPNQSNEIATLINNSKRNN